MRRKNYLQISPWNCLKIGFVWSAMTEVCFVFSGMYIESSEPPAAITASTTGCPLHKTGRSSFTPSAARAALSSSFFLLSPVNRSRTALRAMALSVCKCKGSYQQWLDPNRRVENITLILVLNMSNRLCERDVLSDSFLTRISSTVVR